MEPDNRGADSAERQTLNCDEVESCFVVCLKSTEDDWTHAQTRLCLMCVRKSHNSHLLFSHYCFCFGFFSSFSFQKVFPSVLNPLASGMSSILYDFVFLQITVMIRLTS